MKEHKVKSIFVVSDLFLFRVCKLKAEEVVKFNENLAATIDTFSRLGVHISPSGEYDDREGEPDSEEPPTPPPKVLYEGG